jgi:hypothetical protein
VVCHVSRHLVLPSGDAIWLFHLVCHPSCRVDEYQLCLRAVLLLSYSSSMEEMESVPYITDITDPWVAGAALILRGKTLVP